MALSCFFSCSNDLVWLERGVPPRRGIFQLSFHLYHPPSLPSASAAVEKLSTRESNGSDTLLENEGLEEKECISLCSPSLLAIFKTARKMLVSLQEDGAILTLKETEKVQEEKAEKRALGMAEKYEREAKKREEEEGKHVGDSAEGESGPSELQKSNNDGSMLINGESQKVEGGGGGEGGEGGSSSKLAASEEIAAHSFGYDAGELELLGEGDVTDSVKLDDLHEEVLKLRKENKRGVEIKCTAQRIEEMRGRVRYWYKDKLLRSTGGRTALKVYIYI